MTVVSYDDKKYLLARELLKTSIDTISKVDLIVKQYQTEFEILYISRSHSLN